MSKHFEVYICRLEGKIIYIGSGVNGRHKHCNSCISHEYELNKMHFEGVIFDVQVKKFNNKEESLEHEKDMILKHKPIYNQVFLTKERSKKATKYLELKHQFRKEALKYFSKTKDIDDSCSAFLEFIQHHNIDEMLKVGELSFHPRCYYKNNVSDILFSFYRSYLEGVVTLNSKGYKFFTCVLYVLKYEGKILSHNTLYTLEKSYT